MLALLNGVRARHGLRPLRYTRGLYLAARSHTVEMLRNDNFVHGDVAGRISRFFTVRHVLGENIAWGSGSFGGPGAIVKMWMDSPPHRALILGRAFTRIGVGSLVGAFQGTAGARVVTADFAG